MEYVSRSEWGARAATSVSLMSGSAGVAVHWSAGPEDQSIRTIQDFHMDTRGWTDIAYSWLVRQGRIYEGRGWGRAGAHTAGFNAVVHAVCVVANDDVDVTEDDLDCVATVIEEHNRRYGTGFVRPHRDFAGASTACPGDKLAYYARHYATDPEGFTMEDMRQIAQWEQDTRRLILQGQIRAEEMHKETMVAIWRNRRLIRGLPDTVPALNRPETFGDDGDALLVSAAGADFIASEGRKQLRELDEDPSVPHAK